MSSLRDRSAPSRVPQRTSHGSPLSKSRVFPTLPADGTALPIHRTPLPTQGRPLPVHRSHLSDESKALSEGMKTSSTEPKVRSDERKTPSAQPKAFSTPRQPLPHAGLPPEAPRLRIVEKIFSLTSVPRGN